jgi:hypothetical protein
MILAAVCARERFGKDVVPGLLGELAQRAVNGAARAAID